MEIRNIKFEWNEMYIELEWNRFGLITIGMGLERD